MIPMVRIYDSEERAQEAAGALVGRGFDERAVVVLTPSPGQDAARVRAAVERELLPGSQARFCAQCLQRGRSVVAVRVPFGRGQVALGVLESFGPVDTDQLPAYEVRNPAPLSDLLGIPTLTEDQGTFFGALVRSSWTFSSLFGLGLLSRKAAPLSSLLGMKTLTRSKKDWTTSFGLPLLSRAATPLSSLIGMRTLTKPRKNWERSFGLPLLSKEAAPLSDYLGISVLSKKKERKGRR